MNRSTPGLPVHHHLLEFTQTHIHWVVMPPSHLILCRPLLLLPPSIRVFSNESTLRMRWPKVLEFQLQHHSLQRNPRADLLENGLVGSPSVQGTLKSLLHTSGLLFHTSLYYLCGDPLTASIQKASHMYVPHYALAIQESRYSIFILNVISCIHKGNSMSVVFSVRLIVLNCTTCTVWRPRGIQRVAVRAPVFVVLRTMCNRQALTKRSDRVEDLRHAYSQPPCEVYSSVY